MKAPMSDKAKKLIHGHAAERAKAMDFRDLNKTTMTNDLIKSTTSVAGRLKGELQKSATFYPSSMGATQTFAGFRLDYLYVAASIQTKEELDALIDLLVNSRPCFK